MTTQKNYRMDTKTLAKLAALQSTNPSQNETELIRIAIDLLFAKGAPIINKPTPDDIASAYWKQQIKVDNMNILDSGLELQKEIANELYMLSM